MDPERLLLVEDDATTREVLTLLLESDGWTVISAETGEVALQILGGGDAAADLVLCDLHLPGVQGAALAEAMRGMAPGAARFAISASEASAADRAAYDAVLHKPLRPADVRAAWEQWRTGAPTRNGTAEPTLPGGNEAAGRADLPVIAPATLLKLEQQMGARAKDLYAFALADAGDRLKRMEASLAEGNAANFHQEAHALKGSAGMIGAERLAALAAEAETASAVSWKGSSHETVRRMNHACDQIRLMLETLFPM